MKLTVYLGSSYGAGTVYREQAELLGRWIVEAGHSLVYGGCNTGLMGVLAEAVISNGGEAVGVEPEFIAARGTTQAGLTRHELVKDMAERKTRMIELGDAFIAFPGGVGTLEEISEVVSLIKLGRLDKPAIFFDINGFYQPLQQCLQLMSREGFLDQRLLREFCFAPTVEAIAARLQDIQEKG